MRPAMCCLCVLLLLNYAADEFYQSVIGAALKVRPTYFKCSLEIRLMCDLFFLAIA